MASVVQNKRTSESKFVTIFNDGSDGHTDVDISFREPLLSRPSDHFLVGVDNLTVNLNNLSMIEVNNSSDPDDFLFQIGRLSGETDVTAAVLTAQEVIADNHILHAGTAQAAAHPAHDPMLVNESDYIFPDAYKFRVTNTMQNVQQLAYHLNSHFAFVNDTFVRLGVQEALVHGGRTGAAVNAVAAKVIPKATGLTDVDEHIRCDLTGDGRLRIRASRLFWSTHFILFNDPKYMYMFNGRRRQTSTVVAGGPPAVVQHFDESQYCYRIDGQVLFGKSDVDTHRIVFAKSARGRFCSLRTMPVAAAGPPAVVGWNTIAQNIALLSPAYVAGAGTAVGQTYRNSIFTLIFGANILSTTDRRIALEMGCSLPIVNNPLVDHGKQAPDVVIGRWMFNPMVRIKTTVRGQEMTFEGMAPDVYELQNATDRVQYHSLMPQDKVHMLRVKMYARVRRYNPKSDRFDMITEVYPMKKADWWHTRLHFISKD